MKLFNLSKLRKEGICAKITKSVLACCIVWRWYRVLGSWSSKRHSRGTNATRRMARPLSNQKKNPIALKEILLPKGNNLCSSVFPAMEQQEETGISASRLKTPRITILKDESTK